MAAERTREADAGNRATDGSPVAHISGTDLSVRALTGALACFALLEG